MGVEEKGGGRKRKKEGGGKPQEFLRLNFVVDRGDRGISYPPLSYVILDLLASNSNDNGENLWPDFDAEKEAAQSLETIKNLIDSNNIMLFMKGNKLFPQCGFSNTAVQILRALDAEFETFDVLSDYGVREEIKKYSNNFRNRK